MSDNAASGIAELGDIGKYDPEFRFRQVTGIAAIVVTVFACALSVFHIYTAGFGTLMDMKHRAAHLAVTMALVFLLYPSRRDAQTQAKDVVENVIIALVGAVVLAFGMQRILSLHFLPTSAVFAAGFCSIIHTRRVKFYRQADEYH